MSIHAKLPSIIRKSAGEEENSPATPYWERPAVDQNFPAHEGSDDMKGANCRKDRSDGKKVSVFCHAIIYE